MEYFAVYRSATHDENPSQGYDSICVALFGDIDQVLAEVRIQLAQGYYVQIDQGSMSEADFDAIEEVPDDFVASR